MLWNSNYVEYVRRYLCAVCIVYGEKLQFFYDGSSVGIKFKWTVSITEIPDYRDVVAVGEFRQTKNSENRWCRESTHTAN